jgi:hypothetical protein
MGEILMNRIAKELLKMAEMFKATGEQDKSMEKLERKGFRFKYRSDRFGFIVMVKKERHGWTQAEVDEDGLVNGERVDDYLRSLRASMESGRGRKADSAIRLRDKILRNVDSLLKATDIYGKVSRQALSSIAVTHAQIAQLREMAQDSGDVMLVGRCDRAMSHLRDFDEYVTTVARKLDDAQNAVKRIENEVGA